MINTLTRLVLVNAIYFKGGWLYPFKPQATHEAPFTRLDGSQVNVPLMNWTKAETVRYAQGDGYQIVELPYQGGNAVMTILLPDAGQFTTFEEKLTAQLTALLASLNPQAVKVSLPRFRNESAFNLTQTLATLGMTTALSDAADFSGMTGQRDLFIGAVVHQAFVEVNESGTEAAAATAVIMQVAAARVDQPLEIKVDRPFIYLIRDTQTGAVLFVGRVLDPTQ
jgi:serpin B